MTRSRAEMIPVVTEVSRPKGLPMATTSRDLQLVRVARVTVGSSSRRQAQQREIGVGIAPHHRRLEVAAVGSRTVITCAG